MTRVIQEATMAGVKCPLIRWWNGTVGEGHWMDDRR